MSVSVRILFFGATANVVGRRSVDLELADNSSAKAAFDEIIDEYPNLNKHKLLFSLNQNYITGDERLDDGDELAVFTAVSGG